MKRKFIIPLVIIGVVLLGVIIYSSAGSDETTQLEVKVEEGQFDVVVNVTGELQAKNSENITGPLELRSRSLRIRDIKIQDLIPEGTLVDSGDYVATLDRSEADNTLKDVEDEVQKQESQYTKTKLDTTINLRNLRDDLVNLKFAMEEASIKLEQSKFEPPATIRQAKIDMDKAKRAYTQAQQNYKLKVRQAEADMTEVTINLAKIKRRRDEMLSVLDKFVIHAPKPGMVIYYREWSGDKRKVGSTINPWDLTVATLPDLSTMLSKTYVNEIDISKIKAGQFVEIGVDAFPDKNYTGVVEQVANIGEQLPNTDAKVFEVDIKVDGYDKILRPSMTTSNKILVKSYPDVFYIPMEAVYAMDSIPVVYMKKGIKQVVLLGESNENQIIVEKGLEKGDKVLLSPPDNPEDYKLQGEDLIAVIQQRLKKKHDQEKKQREAVQEKQQQRRGNFKRPAGAQKKPGGSGVVKKTN
ncbi:MAG TPA: efflux RND transporter periplasmic adaptor subunit [Bacteroidales bacterium]|nr:efflux RND transporter periplasmic adaptor subunit [Bacteroidales bacterium]